MQRWALLTLTTEGGYYTVMLAFIIAGAMIRDINLLYVMAGIMLGPLVFNAWHTFRAVRSLEITRSVPSLVGESDQVVIDVTVMKRHQRNQSYALVIEDQLARDGVRAGDAYKKIKLLFPVVSGREESKASYRVKLHRRGRYLFGPVQVSTSAPLGLVRAAVSRNVTSKIHVSPKIGELTPLWSKRLALKSEGGQKATRLRGAAEGEFYGIRDWHDGDSRHWIHWRTTAKRNKLSVRQFEKRTVEDLVVVLDLFQPQGLTGFEEDVERAISFVATLMMKHARQGASHLVVAAASQNPFVIRGNSSPVFRQEVLESLAVVEPITRDTLPEILRQVAPLVPASSKLVFVGCGESDLASARFQPVSAEDSGRYLFLRDALYVNACADDFHDLFIAPWLKKPVFAGMAHDSPAK